MFRRFFVARNKLDKENSSYVLFVTDGLNKQEGIDILNSYGYEAIHSFLKFTFLENKKLQKCMTSVSPLPTHNVMHLIYGVKQVGEKEKVVQDMATR